MARNKHTAHQRFFYHPDPAVGVFDETESGHMVRVLRMQTGDVFTLTDGIGNLFTAHITDAHPKRCQYELVLTDAPIASRPTLHLAVALTKSADRIEWALEKCVEIGIGRFTPLVTERTERGQINHKRLEQIAVSAIKQSRQVWLPQIDELMSLPDFLELQHPPLLIAHCADTGQETMFNDVLSKQSKHVSMLIGPEGDFTPEEVLLAIKAGATPVRFNTPRLRTETAAVFACSVVNSML